MKRIRGPLRRATLDVFQALHTLKICRSPSDKFELLQTSVILVGLREHVGLLPLRTIDLEVVDAGTLGLLFRHSRQLPQ